MTDRLRSSITWPSAARTGPGPTWLMLTLLLLSVSLAGCNRFFHHTSGGSVALQSLADREVSLETTFDHAVYRAHDQTSATMVLLQGGPDQPERALVIQLHWMPRAGSTPLRSSATNATLHYVIFGETDDAPVAIYSGAGFIFPRDRMGNDILRLRLLDASVHLADATDGFVDPLGRARLTGDVTVARDGYVTSEVLDRVNGMIRERLGRARLVLAE